MKKQLKILLAGYGDIANQLADLLTQVGHQVFGLCRTARSGTAENVNMIYGDLRDSQWLGVLLVEAFDVVVISVTPDEHSDWGYKNSYVAVAESFACAVKTTPCPPGMVIWVSSTSVYGQAKGEWVSEDSLTAALGFSGQRQLEAENIIKNLGDDGLVNTVSVRFSGIYGPGRTRLLEAVQRGRVAAREHVVWSNRIHSRDCAGVLAHLTALYAAGSDIADCYLATDCLPVPLSEVHNWIAEKMNIRTIRPATGLSKGSKRCSNQRLLETGYQFHYPTFKEGYQALLSNEKIGSE